MSEWEALILGTVQGLTEFFPVSSSGHLVMIEELMGVHEESGGLVFEIAVHVATLVAIAIFYRARIASLVTGFLSRQTVALLYVGKLVVGTLPAILLVLLAKDVLEEQFSNPLTVGVDLLITGTLLISTRRTAPLAQRAEVGWRDAVLIGCAQAFAILPGISRSGTTVAVALALGIAPSVAAEFSFLLGIIAIAGAAVLAIPDLAAASSQMLFAIGVGGVAALVSGIAAIVLFVKMLERNTFYYFAYYAWGAGAAFLTWVALR